MLPWCEEEKCRAKITTGPVPYENFAEFSSIVSEAPSADFSLGESLQYVYPLLDMVFEYLNYTDLISASKVNHIWRESALRYIKSRRTVEWFSVAGTYANAAARRLQGGKNNKYELKRSKNLLLSDKHFTFVLLKSRLIGLKTNVCVECGDDHTCCKVADYLQKYVIGHPFRETLVLSADHITSHFDVTKKAEKSIPEYNAINALTLPEIPNARIAFIQPDDVQEAFLRRHYVKPSENVSGLLVFCNFRQKANVSSFLEYLLRGQNPYKVAAAGGIFAGHKKYFVGSQLCTKKYESGRDVHFVAFITKGADCSLLSHSLVVRNRNTLEGVAQELIRFKEQITLRSQSVAFRFSCVEKCFTQQEELHVFNSIFPDTPVTGMDVYGEVGWDTIEKLEEIILNKVYRGPELPYVFHQMATTYLLLTWDL